MVNPQLRQASFRDVVTVWRFVTLWSTQATSSAYRSSPNLSRFVFQPPCVEQVIVLFVVDLHPEVWQVFENMVLQGKKQDK